jgi:hypothetical protein
MAQLFIWGGPVNASSLREVDLPEDVTTLVVSGNGSSYFSDLAERYRDSSGHILPSLVRAGKLSLDDFDDVTISGFSAFHGLASKLLDADGDRISAAVLIDACFSAPEKMVKKGYASFAARAAKMEKLMVFTASSGGGPGSGKTIGPNIPDYSFGWECAWAAANAGAEEAHVAFQPFEVPEGVPPTTQGSAERAGNLFILDYRGEYRHDQHINKFGAAFLNAFLVPWMRGERGQIANDVTVDASTSNSSSSLLLPGIAAASLLLLGGWAFYQYNYKVD